MIANENFDALFCIVWIALCFGAGVFVVVTRTAVRSRIHLGLPAIALLALIARLIPALILNRGATYDIDSYGIVGRLVLGGHDVYTSPEAAMRYPYLPLDLWLSAGALALSHSLHVPFVVLVKIPAILADIGVTLGLVAGLLRRGVSSAEAAHRGVLYALNPISILILSVHGQFDSIPLLGLVGAWALVARPTPRTAAIAGLLLGFAILAKTWPDFLVPIYLAALPNWRYRALAAALAGVVPVVATVAYAAAYHTSLRLIVTSVAGYTSSPGRWGLSLPLGLASSAGNVRAMLLMHAVTPVLLVLLAGALVATVRYSNATSLASCCCVSIAAFYVLTPGMASQYLLWIVPFALVAGASLAWAMRYVAVAALTLTLVYFCDGAVFRPLDVPYWHTYSILSTLAFLSRSPEIWHGLLSVIRA